MKYHIITFGCQMNESDSERIASVFKKAGLETSKINDADFIIVNMCSVRQSAVDRIYGLKPIFEKMEAKKILTGCVLKKDEKKMTNFFDYILDIRELTEWPRILNLKKTIKQGNYLKIIPKYSNKFSANVPIMTGCNNFCAYCVVPYSRGREISRPAKEIICEVKNLIKNGYKEVWLLGQNVNSYKDGKINFPKLLEMINDISGEFWIRFTSSHPKDFSDELIKAMKNCDKLPKYLNLPIQAGDDKILKKMNRPYTITKYKNLIKKIRKAMPEISISTDVIVGFPTETKKQFKNTAKLFREIKYDMAYINKYSRRAGTTAVKLKDNIPIVEKKRREKVLTEILRKTALKNNSLLIKKERVALICAEGKTKNTWVGKTTSYKTIKIESPKNLLGKFVKVKIGSATSWGLNGILLK
jgi:tRNA-2-methylthio-N6-dimethylallyladenosine synthase